MRWTQPDATMTTVSLGSPRYGVVAPSSVDVPVSRQLLIGLVLGAALGAITALAIFFGIPHSEADGTALPVRIGASVAFAACCIGGAIGGVLGFRARARRHREQTPAH